MSIRIRYTILLSGWLAASGLQAQLSPGKLTTAHADLEGMFKCTQCHVLGNKLDDNKCLGCHEEIQSLIDLDRGYHSSEEVRTRECAACHSEHHGRNFDMMRFDQENFDHKPHDLRVDRCASAHRLPRLPHTGLHRRQGPQAAGRHLPRIATRLYLLP